DIPSSIGNLQFLMKLFLDNNLFKGSFPQEIGSLSILEVLAMSDNIFLQSKIRS
ncbi:hypothetical protein MKW98_020888, partial [Papaver atlanticum]